MRIRPLVATLALAGLAGCYAHALPGAERCPAKGGAPWREYQSEHFVVDTDLDPRAAAALVDDLERIRALVAAALVRDPPQVPGYVRVVVPASIQTYHAIAPPMSAGYFGATALWEPMVVLHPELRERDPEVIAHELTHHFAWYFFPRQPRWFAEGLAQFVQTVANKEGPYASSAGMVPRIRAPFLVGGKKMPARAILEARSEDAEFQMWSWILYHFLWNQRSRELSEYQRRLAFGEEPSGAWIAAFPEFEGAEGLNKLTDALDVHRRKGEFTPYAVHAQWNGAFSVAPLASADVHMLLLDARDGAIPHVLRTEVLSALEEDPTNPVAIWRKGAIDEVSAIPGLRAAVAWRPGDWRAWLLLAESLGDDARHAPAPAEAGDAAARGAASGGDAGSRPSPGGDARERADAYRRALALNPSSARAHAALALLLADEGKAAEAFPYARRAVELWPSDPRTVGILGRVAADLGACEEARPLEARARDLLPRRGADEARRQLAAIEGRCGGAPSR